MKINNIAFLIVFLWGHNNLFGQKKLIDQYTGNQWPQIINAGISNDGLFIKYAINTPKDGVNLFVAAIDLSWKKKLEGVFDGFFTNDNRTLIFRKNGDTLGILELKTGNLDYISHVANYKVPEDGNSSYFAYQRKDSSNTLILVDLRTHQERKIPAVDTYQFSRNGTKLLMTAFVSGSRNTMTNVNFLDLANNEERTICHFCYASQLTIDETGTWIAFLTKEQTDSQTSILLRYYKTGMDSAEIALGPTSPLLNGMMIQGKMFFSRYGGELFFRIARKRANTRDGRGSSVGARVSINGTNDLELSQESQESFLTVANLNEAKPRIVRLQQAEDKNNGSFFSDRINGKWLIAECNIVGDPRASKWNLSSRPDVYLISTKDGVRRLLIKRALYANMSISPSSKYILWFNEEQKQWFSYNTVQGRLKNITERIKVPIYFENDFPDFPGAPQVAGWLEHDSSVLVYDRYDIWEVDPDGLKPPINITHGFGAANKVRFRYMSSNKDLSCTIHTQDTLFLSAFDFKGKEDGFFRLFMNSGRLEKLNMSSGIYTYTADLENFGGVHSPVPIIKAKNASTYLLSRMSNTEYPNLYSTSDFKNFKPLTNLEPQNEYNWYSTELIRWKLPDGKLGEGILFKPENFSPKSKYPIIFYCYEKSASDLNIFIHPELSQGPMNIPWFVSNGYLVFVPDIYYKMGHPGHSAFNSVVSAASFLSKKPWADVRRMGLQGHSYGGTETEYIMSHTSLFKAVAPASAVSDVVSVYGEIGIPWYYESRQGRIGASLWQRPDLYIENSAVFNADSVTANVLIMQTRLDLVVPYPQGLEMYNALLRLGKVAWLLTYEGESHTLVNEENRLDYSIRLSQFFDHYLRGLPAPKWMTRGVPPELKGKDDGLQLDAGELFLLNNIIL